MVMYAKIRRMHFREHLTISEIQRRTSLSRNTIKKWLKEDKEPHVRGKAGGDMPERCNMCRFGLIHYYSIMLS